MVKWILKLALLFISTLGAAPFRHIYLTWQGDTSRTITLNLHSLNKAGQIRVYYDDVPHQGNIDAYRFSTAMNGDAFLEGEDRRWIYHIELADLEPGTVYYFVTGNEQTGFSEEQRFRTIPMESSSFRFVEGGDFEVTEEARLLARQAARCDPMAILLGGDYPRGVLSPANYKEWDDWLDIYTQNMITTDGCLIPMVMAIGNNDVFGSYDQLPDQAPFFYTYFKQKGNQGYFSLNFGKEISLIVLDSGHTASYEGEQLDFLKQILKENASRPIKFALYHIPIYPTLHFKEANFPYEVLSALLSWTGHSHLVPRLISDQSKNGELFWVPLFDRYRLTCAFEHHDQMLKRTKLLKNGKEDPEGTLYLGDGGWGPEIRYPALQAAFESHFAKTMGYVSFFWLIDITKEGIRYLAINKDSHPIDQFFQPLPR